jgi:hypothetical protein
MAASPRADGQPFAATLAPTSISSNGAMLNGMATCNAGSASAWFEWGTTTSYGHRAGATNLAGGVNVIMVRNGLSGLPQGYVYHYHLVASNAVSVVSGADQQFTVGGTAMPWGNNADGEANPQGVTNVVAVSAGYFHSMTLMNDGTVVAWGYNADGQATVPAGLQNVAAISAGYLHSLALMNDGTITAWGAGTTDTETPPNFGQSIVPAGLSNVVACSAGSYHNLALRSDGTVVAWGDNLHGQATVPAGLSNVVAVAAGEYHSLALKNDGTVVAWGSGKVNSPSDGRDYGQAIVPSGLSSVVAIAAGAYHSLALRKTGSVVAWGAGTVNNPSDGYTDPNTGISVDDGQSIVPGSLGSTTQVSGGGFFSMALRTIGDVAAWGDNQVGETNVPSLTRTVSIASGLGHGLALMPSSLPVTNSVSIQSLFSGGSLVLTWPADAVAYTIESSPVLGTGAHWTAAGIMATENGGAFTATIPGGPFTKFYRLRFSAE